MSDSVGKISLDLEVKSDLQGQISKVSSNITKGIKNSLQGATKGVFSGLENGINKTTGNINKAVGNSMASLKKSMQNVLASVKDIKIKAPKINFDKPKDQVAASSPVQQTKSARAPPKNNVNLEQLTAQISNTEKVLDNVNARIEQQREKLAQLRESYSNIFNPKYKNRIEEQMLKTEANINRLIGQSDKLGFKLSDLDSKFAALKSSQGKASGVTENLKNRVNNLNGAGTKSTGIFSRLGNAFKGLGSSGNTASNGFRNANGGLSMFVGSMLKWGIIFPVIQQGIMSFASFLGSAFMANTQFANSLNLIRSNLYTAFAPIYNAVLPAINALMSALATATAYIASFINNLFGSTYQAGFSAAQNLQNSIGAYEMQSKAAKQAATSLSGAGKAAKKAGKDAEKAIAPFDEINKIADKNSGNNSGGAPGSGVVNPITPMANMGPIEAATQEWADKFKKLMNELLQPIFAAWANEGQNTINAIKYALSGVWDLIKSIGSSFKEVWLNGTGQYTCELILQILQNIFNIIGDIAGSFNKAWLEADTGTCIVQNIWDSLNNVLTLIKDIGDNWRNAWNDNGAGDMLASGILQALLSISGALEDITRGMADSFGKATESLFPVIIDFCTQISNGLSNLADGFKIIWDNGGQVLFDGIVQLIDKVAELAMAMVGDAFVSFSSVFKDVLAPAIGAVCDVIGIVLEKLSEFIDWINSNQSLIDGLTLAFTALFACFEIGKISQMVEMCGSLAGALMSLGIGQTLTTAATTALTIATTIWNGICTIASGVTTALGIAFNFLTSPIGLVVLAITAVIAIGYLLVKNWDWIKEKAGEVWTWIQEKFQGFKDWLDGVFSTDWSQKFGFFGDILNSFLATVSNIWNSIKQIFGGIIDFIAGVFTGDWSRAWSGVVQIFGGIFSGLGAILKAPINAVIGIINGAISAINSISIDIPSWIPGIGGSHFGPHIGKIPYLAKGGIVDQPTLAMVGEAGKEAVMPLENNTGWISNLAGQIAGQLGGTSNGESKQPAQINVYLDGVLSAQKFIDDINDMTKANGGVCPINV